MSDISYAIALLAGLVSFLSPCVLPIVPAALAFLTRNNTEQTQAQIDADDADDADEKNKKIKTEPILHAATFVMGFSTVFVALGAGASTLSRLLISHLDTITVIAGLLIILMGMNMVRLLPLGFLNREMRFHFRKNNGGFIGSYIIGLAFGFGWTPCIGPVLATILAYASNAKTLADGVILLLFYAIGLGLPFIIAAASLDRFLRFAKKFRPRMPLIEKITGTILIATGMLFVTGNINIIANWLANNFPILVDYT